MAGDGMGNGAIWLIRIAGALAVLCGSFYGALMLLDAYDAGSLTGLARAGAEVEIRLNPKVCSQLVLGELSCEAPYVGRHDPVTNMWTLTGRSKDSATLTTNALKNAPDEFGSVSIWGVLGKFTNAGSLIIQGKEAGTVRLVQKSAPK
jgi:hypothetical protein